jgi:cell division protein FtsB
MGPDRVGPPKPSEAQAHVAALSASLKALIEGTQALRVDMKVAERNRRRTNMINMGLLAIVMLFVGLLVGLAWQGNRNIAETRKVNEQLADCTTPGGKCYANAQAQQVRAIGALTSVSIYVSQCGRLWPGESGPDYDRKIEACVRQRLVDAAQQPLPTPGPPASPMPSPAPSGTR